MTTLNVLNRPRLVDDVVRVLREKIVRGELPAGTQLLQIDLANQLGVSRTPLREAFRILENDGFLKTSNNNRTVEVVTFTAAEMRDMYEIREVIDGLAARLAAGKGLSAEAEAEARRLLTEMAGSSKPHDPLRRMETHAAFHSLFLEHSGNARLSGLIPLIRASSAALFLPFIDNPEGVQLTAAGKVTTYKQLLDESQDSHKAIFDAVLEGKAAKAETAARKHIVRTYGMVGAFDDWRKVISEAATHEHDDAATSVSGAPPKRRPRKSPA
ncbi:MAG TPA: GntR family transcriptional regulator [Acidimicrobiia bacterium]|nr:GntR family transcriptional regulator [Acidimicrobiia bacterium]